MRFRLLPAATLIATVIACSPTEPSGPSNPATEAFDASLGVDISTMVKVSDDLYYKELLVGSGDVAAVNKIVTVAYAGYLTNGLSFDSGELTDVPLNDNNLIAGWVVGIPGMKVGGKRKLVIGSALGYGARGNGSVPPNATMVFDVELKAMK